MIVGDHWNAKVYETSGDRGKQARRVGFTMAQERYSASLSLLSHFFPILTHGYLLFFQTSTSPL